MVTHETEVAARARRVIVMKDGKSKKRSARPLCEPSANTSASAREAIGKGDGFGKRRREFGEI